MMNEQIAKNLPEHIPVTVIMEKQPARSSQWVDYIWTAIGVMVDNTDKVLDEPRIDDNEDDVQLKKCSGYQVTLHVDECDSYYQNLMSPTPHCFIVVREDEENDEPEPFIVSLSFDEAHAYLEGGEEVFAVDIPPEIYQWTEAFVLENYCPQQLKKRKRWNWKGKQLEKKVAEKSKP
ncbi:MAG: DUF3305 domain-containing protein [Gammaproteobacteria bacterium]|nr:DUF3305 domain-containing protein [Gammaproteobacteria bacterium]